MTGRYPNPDMVPYATTMPATFPCQLTTENAGKMVPMHNHSAYLNAEGDGNTDVTAGHFHRIKGFKVQPDPSDGHTHQLTMLPCGPSAPLVVSRQGPLAGASDPFPWKYVVGGLVILGLVVGAVVAVRHFSEGEE